MKIAFIGLGTMGGAAALNLIRGNHQLTVCDLDPDNGKPHLALGAQWADTPAKAIEGVEVIFTMVFGPAQITEVMRGEKGVLSAIAENQTWIDMTTNDPTLAKALAKEVRACGGDAIDAPVTGAVDGARSGNMSQFAGGNQQAIERLKPVMELMGPVYYMGLNGTGCVTKLASNQLWAIHATAMGEALVMAAKSGVDLSQAWAALKIGAGQSWCMEHDAPSVFAGHYDPSFSLDLCKKDLDLIVGACDTASTPAPITRAVHQQFEVARLRYGGDKGELHVVKLEEDGAGVSLQMDGDWVPHWQK
jgi:3-hydroxyisobutyrate dehydrogenase